MLTFNTFALIVIFSATVGAYLNSAVTEFSENKSIFLSLCGAFCGVFGLAVTALYVVLR